ncbi:MAG TPA: DUF4140 domain-containing protein [Desulfuromonadaceae bacterium]|jgi:hypothetical protein
MFYIISLLAFLTTAASAFAEARTITFYSDGALVEVEATATKGTIEIPLPSGVIKESLRIKPLGNSTVERVDVLSAHQDGKGAKELEIVLEQKNQLEDRLQALSTREEIFKAAAKSQSGKAPRKTKTNPEPMQSIRQGTDYAIAQLEAVYTARRRAELEVRRLEVRIKALKKPGHGMETIARIGISPKNGRVRLRYTMDRPAWTPRYDLRLNNNGAAQLMLFAQLPSWFDGYRLQARSGRLAQGSPGRLITATGGAMVPLAEHLMLIGEENFSEGIRPSFSFVLTNPSKEHLPSGEAAFYRNGEYWGRFRFDGLSSGRSRRIVSE